MGAQDLFERRRRLMEDWEANLAGAGRDQEARPIRSSVVVASTRQASQFGTVNALKGLYT